MPVNVQNTSSKTLAVVLSCRTSNGVRLSGSRLIPTTLAPGETFVSVPIDMGSMLSGSLTVRVMAGNVVVAQQSVVVRHSYLDRLVLVGGIVVVLAGMLVWIVLRVRRAQAVDESGQHDEPDADSSPERYTEVDRDSARGTALHESDTRARQRGGRHRAGPQRWWPHITLMKHVPFRNWWSTPSP